MESTKLQSTTGSSNSSSRSPRGSTTTNSSSNSSGAAVEALALLKVVAAQLQGPSGAALRAAIASRAVPNDDMERVAGLAQALAGLVEQPPPSPPLPLPLPLAPPVLEAVSSLGSSSSGLTTLASADSLLSSSLSEVCVHLGDGASVGGWLVGWDSWDPCVPSVVMRACIRWAVSPPRTTN
jgi:hypothetical protein